MGTAAPRGPLCRHERGADLKEEAKRCRRLAEGINDPGTLETLRKLADDYEKRAAEAEGKPAP